MVGNSLGDNRKRRNRRDSRSKQNREYVENVKDSFESAQMNVVADTGDNTSASVEVDVDLIMDDDL